MPFLLHSRAGTKHFQTDKLILHIESNFKFPLQRKAETFWNSEFQMHLQLTRPVCVCSPICRVNQPAIRLCSRFACRSNCHIYCSFKWYQCKHSRCLDKPESTAADMIVRSDCRKGEFTSLYRFNRLLWNDLPLKDETMTRMKKSTAFEMNSDAMNKTQVLISSAGESQPNEKHRLNAIIITWWRKQSNSVIASETAWKILQTRANTV